MTFTWENLWNKLVELAVATRAIMAEKAFQF